MRSRRAPTRCPISSPTANTIRSIKTSPMHPLTGLTLLLHTIATTKPTPAYTSESGPGDCTEAPLGPGRVDMGAEGAPPAPLGPVDADSIDVKHHILY
jgi:hypothetical protein